MKFFFGCAFFLGCSVLTACSGASSDSVGTTSADLSYPTCTGDFAPEDVFACSDASCGAHETNGQASKSLGDLAGIDGAACACDGSSAGANSCNVPSDCTGFLPKSVVTCSDGTTAGAHWDCNAGTCAIGYCDASSTPSAGSSGGSSAGSCNTASDCTGFLPQSTELCADGNSSNAQWDCNAGTCAVSYCDNDGGPASSSGSSGGSSAGSCNSASDCTGFLPKSSMLCEDGNSSNAQWDCNAGTCVVSYCDDDGGPSGS